MTPIIPENSARIHTIGHSNRSLPEFTELLLRAGVSAVADVRRFPQSRRNPRFEGTALAAALEKKGIVYRHLPALGGFREPTRPDSHPALDEPLLRGYAEHMDSPEFSVHLGRLEACALERSVAVLCAEADPSRCHRNLLSDALKRDGFQVLHLLGPDAVREHAFSPLLRIEGRRLIYDMGVFSL
jgi:uncharacterized protein (DUF488 family)